MTEQVVLIGADGQPAGTADKAAVHTTDTPLHLAFSAWVLRGREVLITRRALTKKTWPGVWTNAFCGHPGPGEDMTAAVRRRGAFELGFDHFKPSPEHQGPELSGTLGEPELVVPDFSYRAVDSSGIVENEICPVYLCRVAPGVEPRPNPEEVDSYLWVPAAALLSAVSATPGVFSPWMVWELEHPQLQQRVLG
ncbi:isopentenyl-diphosphate delta-isomerase [Corynebacterium phocae]|uniref:Isopentenyl-diphosphate Delta-isomerase n=1 Tax=Corynebacterium phocae TaxID=161895 RepID=A0A1L7D1X4_9CORY|nr:isopentenyl-diphosphate Delta-isomerase [Corynebacterium phocae]APT92104.1 isopentenyl-diphosphate delta-isomerase [Corynebacterium phocae]KAA8726488.1 isopentenyl-diphosphate Delta-isomerase [Corynebacterium phocae]